MKNILYLLFVLPLLFSCQEGQEEGMTICECNKLFDTYAEKKANASSQEEIQALTKEETSKNLECLKLESQLGDKLQDELEKCE